MISFNELDLPSVALLTLNVVIGLAFIRRAFASLAEGRTLRGPPRDSLIAGNLAQLFGHDGMRYHEAFVREYGNAFPVHGLFGETQYFLSDAQAISYILAEPDLFHETNGFKSIASLIFGESLFAATGAQHRRLRKMLNPVFTTKHIRELTGVFYSVGLQLETKLSSLLDVDPSTKQGQEIDVLDWVARAALDCIGIGGLGYTFGALKGSEDPYSTAANQLLPTLAEIAFITPFLHFLMRLGPASFRRVLVSLIPWAAVQRFKSVVDLMDSTARSIFGEKKRTLRDNRNDQADGLSDVLSLTMLANENATAQASLSDEEFVAQMSTLIFAAHDTTSGAITRALQLLADTPATQQRLRAEIVEAKAANGGEELDFDALSDLPFLNAVCQETLRLHPPVSWMSRTSQADAIIPLSTPLAGASGKTPANALTVGKGTTLYLSISGVNTDEAIWGEDARIFRPGRWIETLPDTVTSAKIPSLWSSILSFSAGSRGCIGFRFAILEMKVMLAILVRSFSFLPSTSKQIEWHLSLTQSPHVVGQDTPSLPLIVKKVHVSNM